MRSLEGLSVIFKECWPLVLIFGMMPLGNPAAPFPTMNRAPHAFLRNSILLFVSVLGLMILLPLFVKGAGVIPDKNVSAASARLVARGFTTVESFKENKTEAGFVQYVELTSKPVPMDAEILKGLAALYKPGRHVEGSPLAFPTSAVVLFDEARQPVVILWLFDDDRIGIRRPNEVDANCYQGLRDDAMACTVQDAELCRWLKTFVEKHATLPVDISEWKQEKARKP